MPLSALYFDLHLGVRDDNDWKTVPAHFPNRQAPELDIRGRDIQDLERVDLLVLQLYYYTEVMTRFCKEGTARPELDHLTCTLCRTSRC